MTYITATEAEAYIGDVNGDAPLLEDLILRAVRLIETYTGRRFHVSVDETRALHYDRVRGSTLYLFDDDLCAITSVVNGDGTPVPAAAYFPTPRYQTPYFALTLKASSGITWQYTDDPADAVTITGRWGFSVSPPEDVQQACVRLVQWLYKQKDSLADADRVAFAPEGVPLLPSALPQDVRLMLLPYRRRV